MSDTAKLDFAFVVDEDKRFNSVVELAATILNQDRYILMEFPEVRESHVIGAFCDDQAIGFLRFLVQDLGKAEGRPPVLRSGKPITEAYIEAFGVHPDWRRQGIGSSLQLVAIDYALRCDCYQVRSRSPVTSEENYSLKIAAGYAIQPSEQNDSYYFIKKL
ncbi:MAG: GNAT family N-acetyltransferase [Thermomicrobiales bacterium]|nr:GNAT family N-acetyltransferase [Thermomicrobiales bacterium]